MGTFYVDCKVENHRDQKRSALIPNLLVDTGSEFTWLPADTLERVGVQPVKKDLQVQIASGQIITRTVGYAILRVENYETIDEVVFAQKGDLMLLGSRAMEGMNVHVDARRKRLVAAGPIVAAGAIGKDSITDVARKLCWWQPPEVSLSHPRRFLAQVMTLGTWNEVRQAEKEFGLDAFREVLDQPPVGVFDARSWVYWRAFFGLPEAELPRRSLT